MKKTMLHWLESLRRKGCVLGEGHHGWWIVDLWVRHQAEIAKQRMETSEFSKTKKSTEKQIENQSHVDCPLRLSRNCAPRICTWGSTVNVAFYVEVLKHLSDCVRCVRPNLRGDNSWILHQDNAHSHTALIVRSFWCAVQLLWWTTHLTCGI
jgi:hypothetical protein